ncbi:MAG: hypothetical protein MUF54_16245, partial [Polyangiaceae bacterium]|nr:hypothetical protein [Polyangiaceae bacterium]
MRLFGIGAALGAAAFVLTLASGALAQPTTDEPTGPAPATSPGPGVSLTIGGGISAAPAGQRDEAVRENETADKDTAEKKLPWRGSQFIIGQSATTQTVGIGEDFNSKNSVYELSFTLQPRYYVYDGGDHTVNVNARIALAQELTNSDTTTREREVLFENTTLNAVYGYEIYKDDAGYVTSVSAGPRLVFPTARDSWNSGQRLQLGVG